MNLSTLSFNAFVQGYIEAARESCIFDEDENSPYCEVTFAEAEIEVSEKGELQAIRICKSFVEKAETLGIEIGCDTDDFWQAGWDFWDFSNIGDDATYDYSKVEYSQKEIENSKKFEKLSKEFEDSYMLLDENRKAYFDIS